MLALAEGGLGYTVLSYSSVRERVLAKRLRIWRIVDPPISRSLPLATTTQRPSTRPARALTRVQGTDRRPCATAAGRRPERVYAAGYSAGATAVSTATCRARSPGGS